MNICITTHSVCKGDGQGRVNYEIVKEAIRQGIGVTVVSSKIDPDIVQKIDRWIEISANWPTALLRDIVFSLKSSLWLKRYRKNFDVIKVNGAVSNVQSDINAVHFVHSAWLKSPANVLQPVHNILNTYQWFYTALSACWERISFSRADVVVAVSSQIADELVSIGVPLEKIKVITNGVDLEEFSPGPRRRSDWTFPDNVPLLLFAGDLQTPRKNLDTVLKALVVLPEVHLAVAGKTEGSRYPKLAQQLGVDRRVHFLGYCSNMPELMRSVDLFVFPSRYEPCGLVLLEAIASGVPVITAKTVGGAELIDSNCGIVLMNANSISDLSDAISRIFADPHALHQMGLAARKKAESLAWSNMAQKYISLMRGCKTNS